MSSCKSDFSTLISNGPLVVGAVADLGILMTDPASFRDSCDLIELRLDSLGAGAEVVKFAKACPLPLLVTSRGKAEGGAGSWSCAERAAQYRALLSIATVIDIELSQFDALKEVRAEAEVAKVPIVGSFHDFEKTPELEELRRLRKEAGLFFKAATFVREQRDLQILYDFLKSEDRSSVMGMGPMGGSARPSMAAMGSILNYGYLGEFATAPGQWRAGDLRKAITASQI